MSPLVIKLLVVLVGWAVASAAKSAFSAKQETAPVAPPPALTRRVKAQRGLKKNARPELKADTVAAPTAPPITLGMLQVTRPARATVHADFSGRGALRRAMIAQEVLGPPLALRPPRC